MTAKELASLSRTYKDNLDTIIVMMKRKKNKPDILQQILDRLTKIEEILTNNKIDGILERNNLI